jgi:hypothetical protein
MDEDTAGSVIHFIMIFSSLILAYYNKNRKKIFYLFTYTIIAISLYGLFFKYSSFDIRLLLPIILLQIIVAVYVIQDYLKSGLWYNTFMISFFIITLFTTYFNRAKPIFANPVQIRRAILKLPKGEIDSNYYKLIPVEKRDILLSNYTFLDNKYILNQNLDKKSKYELYKLEDSIGLFEYDKKTVFQKTRLENYFGQQPFLKANFDQLLQNIPKDKSKLNIKTEFDSFEYLVWVYSKSKFDSFYIGSLNHSRYQSYPLNIKPSSFYNIELTNQEKKWSYKILK